MKITSKINVRGMTCSSCEITIQGALSVLAGIEEVQASSEGGFVEVTFDSEIISLAEIRHTILDAGFESESSNLNNEFDKRAQLDNRIETIALDIKYMTCQSCVKTITEVLQSTEGVLNASINLESETGNVTVSGLTATDVINLIDDCGFEASLITKECNNNDERETILKKSKIDTVLPKNNPFLANDDHELTVNNSKSSNSIPMKKFKKNSNYDLVEYSSKTSNFHIKGMTCASCVNTIEKHLNSKSSIIFATVSLNLEQATVEYVPNLINEDKIIKLIEDIGFEAEIIGILKPGSVDLQIFGMTCASCSGKIERELGKMDGIESISVNLLGQSAKVNFNEKFGVRDIIEKIESLGFNALVANDSLAQQQASLDRTKEIQEWKRSFLISCVFSIPVMLLAMLFPSIIPSIINYHIIPGLILGHLLQFILTMPLQFSIGWRFYVSAYKALKHGSYTMDVLITLGTSLSFGFSAISIINSIAHKGSQNPDIFFSTSAMLITFITLGRYLESVAKAKTSTALSKLVSMAPSYVTLLVPSKNENMKVEDVLFTERKIPSELIRVNDLLKIFPGERVSVDGIVVFGESDLEESLVTGEPLPVPKKVGDFVIAGSVNTTGVLTIRAQRVGNETTVSQIIHLVSAAQSSKAPIQATADYVASIFVPVVMFLSLFTFILWMYIVHLTGWKPPIFPENADVTYVCLSMCISVITVACPCALGLATPTAVMVKETILIFRLERVLGRRLEYLLKGVGHYQYLLKSRK